MSQVKQIIELVSIVVLVVGCAIGAARTADYAIATQDSAGFSHAARAGGILHGQVDSDGTACFWLGDGTERVALIWPPGFTAKANPVSVYDSNDNRVGMIGAQIAVSGGLAPNTVVFGCAGFTQAWAVGQVIQPE